MEENTEAVADPTTDPTESVAEPPKRARASRRKASTAVAEPEQVTAPELEPEPNKPARRRRAPAENPLEGLNLETPVNLVGIPTSRVAQHPLNAYRQYTDASYKELLALVKENRGMVWNHPLTVVPATGFDEAGKPTDPIADAQGSKLYWPISGNHTARVCEELGLTEVPAVVRFGLTRQQQNSELMNSNRGKPPTDLEYGLHFLQTQQVEGTRSRGPAKANGATETKKGVGQNAYARRVGKSVGFISECVNAAKLYKELPADLQEAITEATQMEDRFNRQHVLTLADLESTEDRVTFAQAALDNGMSAQQLKYAIDLFQGRVPPPEAFKGLTGGLVPMNRLQNGVPAAHAGAAATVSAPGTASVVAPGSTSAALSGMETPVAPGSRAPLAEEWADDEPDTRTDRETPVGQPAPVPMGGMPAQGVSTSAQMDAQEAIRRVAASSPAATAVEEPVEEPPLDAILTYLNDEWTIPTGEMLLWAVERLNAEECKQFNVQLNLRMRWVMARGNELAAGKLDAATLENKLRALIEGTVGEVEAEAQPVGWEPDLADDDLAGQTPPPPDEEDEELDNDEELDEDEDDEELDEDAEPNDAPPTSEAQEEELAG